MDKSKKSPDNKKPLSKLAAETGIDEAALSAIVGGTSQPVTTTTAHTIEKSAGNDGRDGANAFGNAALDAAMLQAHNPTPMDGASAGIHVDSTHASASAGAGVSNTTDLGHGINLVSQAGANAVAEAHVGATGAAANLLVGAKASETLNLTEHADITIAVQGVADIHVKAGLTGVGVSGIADASAEATVNQHEKGSIGGGLDGHQQTSVGVGADAHAGGALGIGLSGVKGGADAFAGVYAKAEETLGFQGHGVGVAGTAGVYSPGSVGAHESFSGGVHDGKLEVSVSVGGAFLLGGVNLGGNVSIDTKPITDAAHTVAGIAAPAVAHGVTDAAHHVATGTVDAAHTVGHGVTGAANTVGHGVTDTAHTVATGVTGAANTVGHGVTGATHTVGANVTHAADAVGHGVTGAAHTVGSNVTHAAGVVGHGVTGAAHAVGSNVTHAAGVVGHGVTSATHTVGHGVTSAAHHVASHVTHAADVVGHGVTSAAHTVTHGVTDAAHTVAHGFHDAGNSIQGGFQSAGHAITSFFCHAAGTLITMSDGSAKPVEQIKIGDDVLLGGAVLGRGEVLATDLYSYRGTVLNGRHAVFEDGQWLRVEQSAQATLLDVPAAMVYPIVTANHLLVCEQYICADLAEMDEDIGAVGRLAALNANTERNVELRRAEERYGLSQRLAA